MRVDVFVVDRVELGVESSVRVLWRCWYFDATRVEITRLSGRAAAGLRVAIGLAARGFAARGRHRVLLGPCRMQARHRPSLAAATGDRDCTADRLAELSRLRTAREYDSAVQHAAGRVTTAGI